MNSLNERQAAVLEKAQLQHRPDANSLEVGQTEARANLATRALRDATRLSAALSKSTQSSTGCDETLHDHYCPSCDWHRGCIDAYCRLATEDFCEEHGGDFWFPRAQHECHYCKAHDEEFTSIFDWEHVEMSCQEPRNWPCERHRVMIARTRRIWPKPWKIGG